MNGKEAAGRAAVELIEDGMLLGLGTGSTAAWAVRALGERVQAEGLRVRGLPTSVQTEQLALELGIPLLQPDEVDRLDLTIDGADEVDPAFHLVKGGGGALLREKVVASLSDRVVIIVGPGKIVPVLGKAFPLPVEVLPFARRLVERRLHELGFDPVLRGRLDRPFVTDNGNHVLDCRSLGIDDPVRMEQLIALIPGVVECGLFCHLATDVIEGNDDGTTLHRRVGE